MAPCLLDVNVLIALLWPAHESYAKAQRWFARHARQGWATCPITQAAFVRVVSNPAFSPDAPTTQEAAAVLEANLKHPEHQFWADDIGFAESVRTLKLSGHRQVTDAYLLGLALHKRARFATLDRSLASLLPSGSPARSQIELIA